MTQRLSEKDLLTVAANRFDLRALRRQIKEEADREAAELVRQELERILKNKVSENTSRSPRKATRNSSPKARCDTGHSSDGKVCEFEDLEL